jgi:hypothetical protein
VGNNISVERGGAKQAETPVLFIVFNRPDTTKEVFSVIKAIKPKKFYIAADGPRVNREGESEKTELVRKICLNIDWKCDVKTLFSDRNLGCKDAVSSAITWFFENEDKGIILEDDCLPDLSFFAYCEELLEKYKNDSRIMSISGVNFQKENIAGTYSYYFSRYVHVWGWATWRRAWEHYDKEMKLWPDIKKRNILDHLLCDKREKRYWQRFFESTYRGEIDTWDYQWTFSCWMQSGLSVIPVKNLVSNIGFGANATHTKDVTPEADRPVSSIELPLVHPNHVIRNARADQFIQSIMFSIPNILFRVFRKLWKLSSSYIRK